MVATADALTEKPRISSIDIVRGIVMVIMALDHARDFFHLGAMASNPTDLNTTYPVLFFTRWITHFCAPTFVFLAGTSIYLNMQKKPKKELSVFLLTRGLWLIVVEIIFVRFIFLFNFYFDMIFFEVIWAIGASMICLAALIHLPYRAILIIGLVIVFGHNIFDAFPLQPGHAFYVPWAFLRQTAFLPVTPNMSVLVIYPLLPWLGIMCLGFCLGKLFTREYTAEQRKNLLLKIGGAAILLFVIIRFINIYGDPALWSTQKNVVYTFLSFLNVTKYPVSLLFTLMTLGPILILLAFMEGRGKWTNFFTVYGRVPLFYFLLHFLVIHAISLALFLNKSGRSFSEVDFHFSAGMGGITAEAGYSLLITYLLWAGVVLVLYPVCKWYNKYKSTHSHWWLSYL